MISLNPSVFLHCLRLARQTLARQRCSLEPEGKDATVIRERIGSPEGRRTLMSFMASLEIDAPRALGAREALPVVADGTSPEFPSWPSGQHQYTISGLSSSGGSAFFFS
jgi:hypothetical protein